MRPDSSKKAIDVVDFALMMVVVNGSRQQAASSKVVSEGRTAKALCGVDGKPSRPICGKRDEAGCQSN